MFIDENIDKALPLRNTLSIGCFAIQRFDYSFSKCDLSVADLSKRDSELEGNQRTFSICGCIKKVVIRCYPYFNKVDVHITFLNSYSHRVKVKMLLGLNNIAHSLMK